MEPRKLIDIKFLPDSRNTMKRRITKRYRLKKFHHPATNQMVFQLIQILNYKHSSDNVSLRESVSPKMKECADYVEVALAQPKFTFILTE